MGTLGQLETDKVRLEQKVERTSDQLRTFRVHPQYEEIQQRVDALQAAVRKLNAENSGDMFYAYFL
jgi:uncharacterized protein YydD (DUF2326 family)